jgi:hypothetical protein
MILFKLGILVVIAAVYFYMIYYLGFVVDSSLLDGLPLSIEWALRRKALARVIHIGVMEA